MPKLSLKGQMMPASPIRKLVPFADEAREKGKTVYYLNIGQPDIKTPIEAQNAIKDSNIEVLIYSPSAGFDTYRDGLKNYYGKLGIKLDRENIMVTTGGSEAISFAFNSIMDAGDEVIIPEPFYANYNGFATAAGIRVVPVVASIDEGFALPPITEFEKMIGPNTKAIMICNPGNPTGYLYSKEELKQLKDLVLKHDLYLIADEVYREFCYDGERHHSIMSLKGLKDHAIMVDSVSKRYSMCGARIGTLISRNKDVMETALKFAQARLSPPTYAQVAAEAALKAPQSYFDEVIEEYIERRNTLVDGLNSIPGIKCPMPKGAFYCIAELPVEDTDAFCQWMLSNYDHNNETLMMAPAAGFYSSPEIGSRQVRLAYVLEKESLKRAVEILRHALEEYPATIR